MATVITAYIGSSKIKLCEMVSTSKGATIKKASIIKTPEGFVDDGWLVNVDGLMKVMQQEFALQGMNAKEITFVVQSSKIAYKEVFIPVIKTNRVNDMVKANASDYFPINVDDYAIAGKVISQVVTAEGDNQLRVGVYAAQKDMIDAYYELADKLGLVVNNIESYNNATAAFLSSQIGPESSVVIQIHDDSTTVSMFKDNILEFQRSVPYGKNVVINATMEHKRINRGEADRLIAMDRIIFDHFGGDPITESLSVLVGNVSRVIEYYNSRNADRPVEKAYLTGESVVMLGLDRLMTNELDFEVTQIMEFNGVTVDPRLFFEKKMVSVFVANVGAVLNPISFETERAARSNRKDNTIKYLMIGLIASAAIGVVAIAVPLIEGIFLRSSISDYEEKIEKVRDIELIVNEHYNAKDKVSDVEKFVNMSSSANDYMLEFIQALEKGMPSDISIRNLTINNGQVSISAATSTKQTIAKFITQLNGMNGVSNVFVSNTSESKDEYGVVTSTFSITFTFDSQIKDYVAPQPETEASTDENTEGEAE